jgi:hypothetical protein
LTVAKHAHPADDVHRHRLNVLHPLASYHKKD